MEQYTLSQILMDELDKNFYVSLEEEIMPTGRDGARHYISNFVGVNFDRLPGDEKPYEVAVREYAHIRDLINAEKVKKGGHILLWSLDEDTRNKLSAWDDRVAFFMLPENLLASFLECNTPEFSDFCESNGVNYIVKEDDHYNNLTRGCKFKIECEEVPGMTDDAATYLVYSICFLTDAQDE